MRRSPAPLCRFLVVMLVMVYLARSKHKGINSTLFAVFYRDGLYYFACLSGTSSPILTGRLLTPHHVLSIVFAVVNAIMGFIGPVRYKFLLIQ